MVCLFYSESTFIFGSLSTWCNVNFIDTGKALPALLIDFSCLVISFSQAVPKAEGGFLDLRSVDLNNTRVALRGDWYYFGNQLVSPIDIDASGKTFGYFPKIWNENANAESGSGFATYANTMCLPKGTSSLALEIPQLYSSYSLYSNDNLVAVNGRVGATKDSTSPQWMPQTVSFENTSDTVKLVLQIANFHHHNGGAKDPLYLGSSAILQQKRSMAVTANLVESIALTVIAVTFLGIYFFWSRKKVIMYFALLCLTWAVRVGFSNLYVFISYWPDFDWATMVRIEYMTLFFTMIWGILFIGRVFPKERNTIVTYLLVVSNCVFLGYTIFATPVAFTHWLTVYLVFSEFF